MTTNRKYMAAFEDLQRNSGKFLQKEWQIRNKLAAAVGSAAREMGFIQRVNGKGSPIALVKMPTYKEVDTIRRKACDYTHKWNATRRHRKNEDQTYTHTVDLSMADLSKEARDFIRSVRPVDPRSTFRTKLEGNQLVLLPPRERKKDTVKPVQKVGLIRRFINWIY